LIFSAPREGWFGVELKECPAILWKSIKFKSYESDQVTLLTVEQF